MIDTTSLDGSPGGTSGPHVPPGGAQVRARIRVQGVVQGVGFRPFVYARARELELSGFVGHDADGVLIEIEGAPSAIHRFETDLPVMAPPLAIVANVVSEAIPVRGDRGFTILASQATAADRSVLVSPDIATCADCLRELFDPADRRHRYPFITCVNCGPRFTIATEIPYDRASTTMSAFRLCPTCTREYQDPAGRRFHAQATCCPGCGPTLRLVTASGGTTQGDPIIAAARLMRAGRIVAIKGLGGYHLAADASDENAVRTLRTRKRTADLPFTVMAPDLDTAERLCEIDQAARSLLTGPRRPVTLLPRRPGGPIAEPVAPGSTLLGIVLPYTPIHHLLAAEFGGPFVLTPENLPDGPIIGDDEESLTALGELADAVLTHDRPIHMASPDSIVRVSSGRATPVRRSRGYAPQPLPLGTALAQPILGCGGDHETTFCLAKGTQAFLSQHLGDITGEQGEHAYAAAIAHYQRLFDTTPRLIAHDLDRDCAATRYALALPGAELVGVQHHHAHIAACLADNEETGPVIGVAFDGLGTGPDDTLWGGEFLVADLLGFVRAAHLAPVRLPGGPLAIREPWRMAAAYLDAAHAYTGPLDVRDRHANRWEFVLGAARSGTNSPLTTSAARLFDAVASILGVRDRVGYYGQAVTELEQRADPVVIDIYPTRIRDGHPLVLDGPDLIRSIVDDLQSGTSAPVIAARFHNTLAAMIVETCERIRASTGVEVAALTGEVFNNRLLLDRVVPALTNRGFRVLTHLRVPPGDGGIALGQVAVAAARDRAGS